MYFSFFSARVPQQKPTVSIPVVFFFFFVDRTNGLRMKLIAWARKLPASEILAPSVYEDFEKTQKSTHSIKYLYRFQIQMAYWILQQPEKE